MTYAKIAERNAAIKADAPTHTAYELCAKYRMNYSTLTGLLRRFKIKSKRKVRLKDTRDMAIVADAPTMSYSDLVKKYGLPRPYIVRICGRNKVRIGMRENMRRGISTDGETHFKQLRILAELKKHERPNYSQIGLSFHVTREMVSQIAFKSKELGLL